MFNRTVLFCLLLSNANMNALAYQDGWTAGNILNMTDSCVASILDPVRQGYKQKMQSQGKDASLFPEDLFKPSISDLCACITFRAADTYNYQQVVADPELTQSFMTEAIKGGQCKPTGLLGNVIKTK